MQTRYNIIVDVIVTLEQTSKQQTEAPTANESFAFKSLWVKACIIRRASCCNNKVSQWLAAWCNNYYAVAIDAYVWA